ncbi:hypothetical protein ACF07T_40145 [Streptomyces sp. NPDC015184]|uniref:hypothetical protein n=1 Tax=Streptomyces sp. NPDC015184 TaxID=3364946 RepID=UPI003701586E
MGRRERPLDTAEGPVAAFARALRELRHKAGGLTHRAMAGKEHCSAETLAQVAAALSGPVFVVTVCLVVAVGKRAVLPRTPPGIHPVRSALGARKWIADKPLEHRLLLTSSLYATLYTVPWLRLLGARVGRRAEVSTAAHLDPDLLTVEDGGFVADMAGIGLATFAAGRMAFWPTEVGGRAFVGNAALVPAGARLGPGFLVGVGTVPPGRVSADSTWLGSPACGHCCAAERPPGPPCSPSATSPRTPRATAAAAGPATSI